MNSSTIDPIRLVVLSDGTCRCLYTEAIELGALGRLAVKRATVVQFDNPAQLWRVFDSKGRCIFSAPSRAECIRWEQHKLADRLINELIG